MKIILKNIPILIVLVTLFMSCKREDAYKDFAKEGSIVYPGKPNNLIANAGKNRAKISWLVVDVKVAKYVVYWNNRQDSLIVNASGSTEYTERTEVFVNNLLEDDYVFEVVSVDAKGQRSIVEEAFVNVYGEKYIDQQLNRPIKKSTSISGVATIIWGTKEDKDTGVELNYTDKDGVLQTVNVAKRDTLTRLTNFQNGTQFTYRTLILPDSNAIDVIKTKPTTPSAPIITYPQLDRTKMVAMNTWPGDTPSNFGWTLNKIFDGKLGEGDGYHSIDVAMPQKVTFDMGLTTALREIKVWPRQDYPFRAGNLRKYEIWGTNDQNAGNDESKWIKLLTCESKYPSGSASPTAADEAWTKAGESYIFPGDSPAVRYIRIKILQTWTGGATPSSQIMEVALWSN